MYIYCVCKTPALDDPFAIHWESKWHARFVLLTSLNVPICMVYIESADIDDETVYVVPLFLLSMYAFCMLFVSSYLVPRRCTKKMGPILNSEKGQDVSLKMVLSDPETLNSFMNHLSTEFSLRAIICFY